MMENTKWRKFGNGNSVVDANHSYLTAHLPIIQCQENGHLVLTNAHHKLSTARIRVLYPNLLDMWNFCLLVVCLVKRHKYYTLGRSRYSYRESSHMVFQASHFHGNCPIWKGIPLTKMPASHFAIISFYKWGQTNTPGRLTAGTWE